MMDIEELKKRLPAFDALTFCRERYDIHSDTDTVRDAREDGARAAFAVFSEYLESTQRENEGLHSGEVQRSSALTIDMLKDRLRSNAEGARYCGSDYIKAADAIESLQRENQLLRHEQLQLAAMHAEDIAVLKQKLEEAAEKALGYASKYDSLAQAITDPENQPSQYGTAPLKQLEEARKDVARLDFFELHPRAVVRSNGYLGSPDSWSWRDEHGQHTMPPVCATLWTTPWPPTTSIKLILRIKSSKNRRRIEKQGP